MIASCILASLSKKHIKYARYLPHLMTIFMDYMAVILHSPALQACQATNPAKPYNRKMNKVKMMLLTIFLVSFFVCNSYDIGVNVTQIDKTIWTIYLDKKSKYWFGSQENGVYYYNGQRLKHITTKNG